MAENSKSKKAASNKKTAKLELKDSPLSQVGETDKGKKPIKMQDIAPTGISDLNETKKQTEILMDDDDEEESPVFPQDESGHAEEEDSANGKAIKGDISGKSETTNQKSQAYAPKILSNQEPEIQRTTKSDLVWVVVLVVIIVVLLGAIGIWYFRQYQGFNLFQNSNLVNNIGSRLSPDDTLTNELPSSKPRAITNSTQAEQTMEKAQEAKDAADQKMEEINIQIQNLENESSSIPEPDLNL